MSQAVRIAVASRLIGDSALAALLAVSPFDPTKPAIFNASKNQAPPVYDCLTYRMSSEEPDKRFEPPIPGAGESDIIDLYIDCEAWSQKPDSANIEAIGARLRALFANQSFDAPPDGRIFKSEWITARTDIYDNKLNCWCGLWRFRLRLALT